MNPLTQFKESRIRKLLIGLALQTNCAQSIRTVKQMRIDATDKDSCFC